MRVLMLGPFPRSLSQIDGGVAAATTYLCQSLAVLPGIELIGIRLGGRGVTQGITEDLGWPVVNCELGRFAVSTMFSLQRRRFSELVRYFRPDIVHAQGTDASGYLAVRSDCPTIVTVHGILTECAKFGTKPIGRWREKVQARITERLVVERAKHVIAISPYVTDYYRNRLRAHIYDVPNAIASTYFEVPRQPEIGRVLFAGRVSPGKGIADLVQAIRLRPESAKQVVIAGKSPDADFERQLRTAVMNTGLADRFHFAGLMPEEALLREFARASVLVLPSYQETAPMVIQQAMAAGLPVIASRVGGIPNLIEHNVSGLLFEPGSVEELAHLLMRVQNEPELSVRLSGAARQIAAEKFSCDLVARATLSAYQKVLDGARPP